MTNSHFDIKLNQMQNETMEDYKALKNDDILPLEFAIRAIERTTKFAEDYQNYLNQRFGIKERISQNFS